MAGSKREYSPRRVGEVVGVEVVAGAARPVRVEVFGHRHVYEVAVTMVDGQPALADLRVCSPDGEPVVPITTASLRRINAERLLRTAVRHATAAAADAAAGLREAIDAATGTTQGHEWIEQFRFTEGVMDAMARHAPPGYGKPRGGRPPKWSREFLKQVRDWAREAVAEGRAVYPYVAARASQATGADYGIDHAKWWIKKCKDADLLGRDELRAPRKPPTRREDG